MFLIYAYIAKYKNYVDQEISFDPAYEVTFQEGELSFAYCPSPTVFDLI